MFSILITEINEKKLLSVNSFSSQFTRISVWMVKLIKNSICIYIFQMVSSVFFNYTLHKDWIGTLVVPPCYLKFNFTFLNMLKAFKTRHALLVYFYMGLLFTVTFCFLCLCCRKSRLRVTGPSGKPGKPGDHGRPVSGWLACLVIPLWVMKRLQTVAYLCYLCCNTFEAFVETMLNPWI